MRRLVAITLLSTSGGCAGISLQGVPPSDEWPSPEAHAGADAVVLSEEAELSFNDDADPAAGYSLTIHARVALLTPGGRELGRVYIPLGYWTSLEEISARSFDPRDPDAMVWA